jgi:hypothetical protein
LLGSLVVNLCRLLDGVLSGAASADIDFPAQSTTSGPGSCHTDEEGRVVREEWLRPGDGSINDIRQMSICKGVSSYHGVYSFVFDA